MKLLFKLIILAAVFYLGFYFGANQALATTTQLADQLIGLQSVSLMVDYGNDVVSVYNDTKLEPNQTVFDLLRLVASQNNLEFSTKDFGGELGVFIESIGGIENNSISDHWWQYWVNNQYAKIGASQYRLSAGDIVEWKFIKGQLNNN